ncbi:annexin-like protein RJ4 [Panicum virgatum]|uniref:annexin-like protein RJ4 n=1 Tax=Panicum virgatum TaxID=38727 RepID=UPI0019D5CA9C|nr:annexin-like protein RJ4 [Panicum virgatum]
MAINTVSQVVPSPAEDAAALLKAFQVNNDLCQLFCGPGWGTDEQAVIAILARRDATQRKQISLTYEQMYNEGLLQRLQSELSGDFERAMCQWILGPDERQAVIANAAMKCIQEEYPVIIEIACANSSEELIAVKKAYHVLYKCSLEEDVAAGTTGNLRSLLLALVSTYRYDGNDVNMGLAKSEAKIVHEAVRNGTLDHQELVRIVGTRSKAQLKATFSCFKDEHSRSITKALLHASDPTCYLRALRTTVRCIADENKYFAKQVLRNATREAGTDEDTLTRVVVMHAEKDLKGICGAFQKRTSVTLEQVIAKETSGDYRSFLMALLGS